MSEMSRETKSLTLVKTVVFYDSADDLQKSIDMGLEGGLASTMERLDELLLILAE